jgi:hypothetical protein
VGECKDLYIGTVEAQGRGSLHLHLLVWLSGASTANEMKDALGSSEFLEKVNIFIQNIIKADLDGWSGKKNLAIQKLDSVAYSRPLNPQKPEHQAKVVELTAQIARMVQYHKCSVANYLKMKNSQLQCKQRTPFMRAEDDWVNKEGDWGPKILCGFMNNWNPPLLVTLRANHNIKLIMHGGEKNVLTWYITNYATKKQQQFSNVSTLLAK